MLRSSEKMLIHKILFGKIGLLILVIVFAIFAKGTWSVYQKASYAEENHDRAQQELQEIVAREEALKEELERLNTERGLEEEIRQKFDVGREGEQLIVLVDAPDVEPVAEIKEPTIWEKIVELFGFK